ncbi:MAG: GTP-binding protein [Lachnospiraceae bacterium]
MRLITVAGQPASGKTSALCGVIREAQRRQIRAGVVKFDCLHTEDAARYRALGVPAFRGLSQELCPDHFFISNVEEVWHWGEKKGLDLLFTESAGLCNRCSPYLTGATAVCVVDQLGGIHAPQKIGPMLRLADLILVTKADVVSQAERDVFRRQIGLVNPTADVLQVNGLTGQGAGAALDWLLANSKETVFERAQLRFPMPMALCSYCLGETRIGEAYQIGNVKKMNFDQD